MESISEMLLDGLTTYAIERQSGLKVDPASAPRKNRIRDILHTAAKLNGVRNPECLVRQFDERLERSRGCIAVITASTDLQRETIQALCRYTSALAKADTDQRPRLLEVKALLEDMEGWPLWDVGAIGLYPARGQAKSSLRRLTAQRPIRFTRLFLGPEQGPCESAFLAGSVTRADDVRKTKAFQALTARHPEVPSWPASCVVYGKHDGHGLHNASELDLTVIRQAGKDFLNEPGLCNLTGLIQLQIEKHRTTVKKRVKTGRGAAI